MNPLNNKTILDPKNPMFSGETAALRKNTVCFIDKTGWLCYIPFGTMTWFFEVHVFKHSFPRWFGRLKAKDQR